MTTVNMNPDQLITRRQAAEFLGCKENTLAVWATNQRYDLPFYKVGRLVKYKLSDLENFIDKNQQGVGNDD
jgi:excisionase family DNA binding protein